MAFHIKAGGTWQPAKVVRVRVAGTWTLAKTVSQKIAGVWTVIWTAMTASCAVFVGGTSNSTRTVSVTGGTAPITVTSVSIAANYGPNPGYTTSGLTVTLGYTGEAAEGIATITVTDANGSTAVCTAGYAFTDL